MNAERINETNPFKIIEYLWDNPESFSITLVGSVLSLTTGGKSNQAKIKIYDSKIKTAVIYMEGNSCRNKTIHVDQIQSLYIQIHNLKYRQKNLALYARYNNMMIWNSQDVY